MKTQVDQTRDSRQAADQKVQSGPGPAGTATLEDNRLSTIYQRRLQGKMNVRSSEKVSDIQQKENDTGLPGKLKSGMEALSGYSMDDVKVHYNSSKPAQLQAHAYAQGTEIHLAPGQEKHLPHEAWHVVQQKQGRVKSTRQLKGNMRVNDDTDLEKEADLMGEKALEGNLREPHGKKKSKRKSNEAAPVQLKTGFEVELNVPIFKYQTSGQITFDENKIDAPDFTSSDKAKILSFLYGGPGNDEKEASQYQSDVEGWSFGYDYGGGIAKAQDRLAAMLFKKGIVSIPGQVYNGPANMEYRTAPFNELYHDPKDFNNSDFDNITSEIQAHAMASTQILKSKTMQHLPLPAKPEVYTGIPITSLRKIEGEDEEIKNELDELERLSQETPKIYVQTNFGVYPSEIPMLFEKGSDRILKGERKGLRDGFKYVLRRSREIVEEKRSKIDFFSNKFNLDGLEIQALEGWLMLIVQYQFGRKIEYSALDITRVHQKNHLAYLSKLWPKDSFNTLPRTIRDNFSKEEKKRLVNLLIELSDKVYEDRNFYTEFGTEETKEYARHNLLGKMVAQIPGLKKLISISPGWFLKEDSFLGPNHVTWTKKLLSLVKTRTSTPISVRQIEARQIEAYREQTKSQSLIVLEDRYVMTKYRKDTPESIKEILMSEMEKSAEIRKNTLENGSV